MSYKEDLLNRIDLYFKEISEKYRITTMDAMTDARKVSILKKRDFWVMPLTFKDTKTQ